MRKRSQVIGKGGFKRNIRCSFARRPYDSELNLWASLEVAVTELRNFEDRFRSEILKYQRKITEVETVGFVSYRKV